MSVCGFNDDSSPPAWFDLPASPPLSSFCLSVPSSSISPGDSLPLPLPSAEERGGSVPPAVARDERDPGPEAAGAGGSPDPRPHEGRQAAHHSQAGLGQRVSVHQRPVGEPGAGNPLSSTGT